MRQLSVQQMAMAGMAAAAVMVLALAAFAWNFATQTQSAAAYVSHTQHVIGVINDLESSLYRAEAGQRAYLATRVNTFLAERNAALIDLERGVNELGIQTADNPGQATRVQALRHELGLRIALYRQSEAQLIAGEGFSLHQRMEMGVQALENIRPLIAAMTSEEARLLHLREAAEAERSRATTGVFAVLVLLLLVLLPLVFFRMYRDLNARKRAEALVAGERFYDDIHARALALYNLEGRRETVLDGTLSLLGENPLFPVGVFYVHEEWGGALRLVASRAAPADVRPLVRLDEGLVGTAARTQQPIYIEGFDADRGWRIETGLASVAPASMLICPVQYQGRLLGVLALAASAPLAERDKAFVQRVGSQLAVALHNLGQLEELTLLADQLRSRGEDIQLKNAELEKASRLKSEFLANMSHELRTPLNAIIGFSEIMKDGLSGEMKPEQREYVSDIHLSGKHLLSLINDILDLSKVESGHAPLDLEVMEPLQLAASTVSMLRDRAATGHIRLVTLCPPQIGSLRADVRKTKQIVYNLVSNALKFTLDNGTVTLAFGEVDLDAIRAIAPGPGTRVFPPTGSRFDRFLEIRVTDSGIGISPEGLRQLFQPFVQIDSSLSRQFAGTGLGLTMVKRLAELHDGGLMAQSTEDIGSTFTVWLPWRPVDSIDASEAGTGDVLPPDSDGLAGGAPVPPLVLVIEDDPHAVSLMRVQLQAQGYRVEFAHTAEEGLQRAVQLRPAALVLDIILPGMDGWDMLSQMKEKPETRHIPVVIVSITDEMRRGFALGAAQVLVKPVSQEDLLAALAAAGLDKSSSDVRVLVVDDDPRAVALVSKHLQVAGYTPIAAFGGQEALELSRHQAPDIVLLDLMMPGVSGFDVVRQLRATPQTAEVPIIVLTAKLLSTDDRVQLQGRVQQVMEKSSFDAASLLAEVRRSLVKKRMHRA